MVGIGGGIPGKEAVVRLSDIVVGKPTRDCGGVIQYDYGKTVSDGHFERTGVLNKPPAVLLTAISQLQAAAHKSRQGRLTSILSDAIDRDPDVRSMFAYLDG
jgi:hypothetical protein